jgi:uncharacterized protein YgiM (DUF1202 family)
METMKKMCKHSNRIMLALLLAAAMLIVPVAALADDEAQLHAGVGSILMGGLDAEQPDTGIDSSDLGAGVHTVMTETFEAAVLDEIMTDEEAAPAQPSAADSADESQMTDEIVTDIAVPEEIAEAPAQQQAGALVMANVTDAVNVRVEPNEEAQIAGKLFAGCGAQFVEQQGDWTHIISGKLEGWTKNEFLFFGQEAEDASKDAGKLTATVTTETLRIRRDRSEDAEVIDLAAEGQELTAIEDFGDWVSVKYDGEVGFVAKEFVNVEFSVPNGKTTEQIQAEEQAKAAEKEAAEKAKKKGAKKGSGTTNRGAVDTAASDVSLLAALIQCEAGRECYEGQLAVGAVVMNRVRSGAYPNSISAVITAPSQFPPATNGRVAAVLASGPSASCVQAAQAAIAGQSNVGGATHFGTSGSGITIGNHTFW